ncbi:MAG: DegT/DnrJ/EryC1/StrS family aminotransferase [Bacteroidota bacterium]|nr:DegT/DnrJ/EryC1/StrS family aminotransferase [Bacteroidota bacterium]
MKRILVTQTSMPPFEEYVDEIKDIWESHWLTNMGPKHNLLEKKLKDYLSVDFISLFTNGHNALELCLQAMGLRGEVITTPFTFASTTHAIVRNGLTPVFCDINPIDYTIDVTKIEDLITDKTTAIVPVHVYGHVCNVEEIERIAKKFGLKVIYDAAHVFGVRYKGQGIGHFGDASMFSFHATKVYHTIEGGAVCYHDEDLGRELFKLRDFGIKDSEIIDGIGSNAKMNEFVAAMGLCTLRHVDDEIAKRRKVVECYRNHLYDVDGIQLPPIQPCVEPNYSYFPIVIDETVFGATRNEVCAKLAENNVFARKYFYPLTNAFDAYHNRFDVNATPIALHISNRVLTLPLYADLALEDVERICCIIKQCRK